MGLAVAVLLPLVMLLGPPAVYADEKPAHRLLKGFQLSGQYILVMDGKQTKKAKIYHSRLAAAYLILQAPFDAPLLISPRTRKVQSVSEDQMVERDDGNIYFNEDVEPDDVGSFRFDRGNVVFTVDGKTARLQPNPPLLGVLDAKDLIEHTPEYVRDGLPYKMDAAAIKALKERDGEVEVLVVFGSWCPSCKRYIPFMLKVEEALKDSDIKFRYHGLPRPPKAWRDPAFIGTGLKRLPAVVVTSKGRVIGKLSGSETGRPEIGLRSVLR